jgi:hypothetical protein
MHQDCLLVERYGLGGLTGCSSDDIDDLYLDSRPELCSQGGFKTTASSCLSHLSFLIDFGKEMDSQTLGSPGVRSSEASHVFV